MIPAENRCVEYITIDGKDRRCMREIGHSDINHRHVVAIGDASIASEGQGDDVGCCSVDLRWHISPAY